MLKFSALPDRPLTIQEAEHLDQFGRFESVVPVGVVSFKGPPVQLLCGVVIVTSARLVGLAYDITPQSWELVYGADHEDTEAPSDGAEFSEASQAVENAITNGGPEKTFTDGEVNAGLTTVSQDHQEALLSQYLEMSE